MRAQRAGAKGETTRMNAQNDPDLSPTVEEQALRAYRRPFWEKKRWWVVGSIVLVVAAVLALR
jgi:putative copper export protein